MRKLKFILAICFPVALSAQTNDIPEWFKKEIEVRTGEWITSNADYQNENEPYQSYGMTWTPGPGGKSITGTLYGILDGKKTVPFWEFKTFYHPAEKKVYAYQFGIAGVVGMGEFLPGTMDQTFYHLNGTVERHGHKAEDKGGEHITESFDVDIQGVWTMRRKYTWKRVK